MNDLPFIPLGLAHRPTVGGLVVPWITPQTPRGHAFGAVTNLAQQACLNQRRCQVCGQPMPRGPADRAVLFARASDVLHDRCTVEPPLCVGCAAYSRRACPMLAGRREQFRASRHPALAGVLPAADERLRRGAPAEPWYAVWVERYDVIHHPAQPHMLAASWQRIPPLRIRPVPAQI